jgi:hypothetical protein
MKKEITLIVFTVLLLINIRFVCATEIALEPTKIPEGNFSILLYKPVRSELPLRNKSAGFTIITYSYQSYFPAFDVSYAAGFTDWTPSKEFEIKKYGYPLTPISEDLETSVQGVKAMTEKRLQMDVNLLESREKKYETHFGREAKFEFLSSGLRYIIKYRTYMIGYKEYWHQVVYPQQYERYVCPQTFLDSFKVDLAKSAEYKYANNKLWDDESYTWFANLFASLTKFLKTAPSKIYVEQELRQLPNSKPYIKNGQYQGQSIILDNNKEFMFIFFGYSGGHVSDANIAFPPLKQEGILKIYDLIHRGLSKHYTETKKNVFDVGNGYYAFIDQDNKSYTISILKAKKSAVQ